MQPVDASIDRLCAGLLIAGRRPLGRDHQLEGGVIHDRFEFLEEAGMRNRQACNGPLLARLGREAPLHRNVEFAELGSNLLLYAG